MNSALPFPRKRLGQHFLVDHNIARKIVELAAVRKAETVLEIGPGRGILTRALCHQARHVLAIEIDRQLVSYLKASLSDCENLDLRLGDALDFPYHCLEEGTVVVGNLPYYLSTPLLFKLLEARARIDRMILMLQAEVAKRLVAKPGTRDYGVLSVLVQYWTVPSFGFRVAPSCFRPKPAVSSAMVTLGVRARRPVAVEDERNFVRTVRAAFAHRRKTVANSLRDEGFSMAQVDQALTHAGIASSRRAETLTLEDFACLAEALGPAAESEP